MKKISFILSTLLLLPIAAFAKAPLALEANTSVGVGVGMSASSSVERGDDHMTASTSASMEDRRENESENDTNMRRNDDDTEHRASTTASTTASMHGHEMSESHRSVVAAFVRSLLADADRDGGIGTKVRSVANAQNDDASTTVQALTKIEDRSAFTRFFLGSDWKNLGTIRSQILKNDADIASLETALASTTNASVRADLSAQIQVLKNEQVKLQAFIDQHSTGFSLFGWLTKLFAGNDSK